MKALLIDIGNTNARIATADSRCFDDVVVVPCEKLIAHLQQQYADEQSVIFATVGKQTVANQLCSSFRHARQITTPAWGHGVINAYQNNAALGVDRWLALVGLRAIYKGPAIVVDIGTAVTVELMDEFGQHKGGWIIPGMEMMINSLMAGTERVASDYQLEGIGFACSTAKGVTNGCLAAINGVVQQAIVQARSALGSRMTPRVVLTGGQAEVVSSVLTVKHDVDPMLVLRGLAQYARQSG